MERVRAMQSLPAFLDGCNIFPCIPGDKLPATKGGWHEASNDPAQIAAWLKINPDFNWAVATGPSGLFVIDVDPNGLDWWTTLLERDADVKAAVDQAYQVRTPRGGLHVYFKGEGPSTASRIAEGIDTRGGIKRVDGSIQSGGYVLLPGSKTKAGAYSELPGGSLNSLPQAIRSIIPERQKTDTFGLTKNPDKDLPRNIRTANDLIENYVKSGRVSVEGKGGNNLAFQVATSILDKGISPGLCFDLLWEKWNPHCQPAWDEWELEILVRNAASYGEDTESGAKGYQSNEDAFANFVGMETPELTAPKAERSARNRLMWIHEYADGVNDPEWLIPGLLPASGTGMLYGQSGSYKSFLALDWALCLGFGIAGQCGAPPVKNDVLYFAGEGSIATAKKRWPAWMDQHDIEFRADHRFIIFDRVPFFTDTAEWEQIKQDLGDMKAKPALIVIDTTARLATGLDENSATDATKVTNFAEQLARYYECFVLLVHHEGKDANRGARGSSAWIANVDTALNTKKVRDGTELRVKKQKDADVPDDIQYLRVTPIGNSIVLLKDAEGPSEDIKLNGSKYSWAEAKEVVEMLSSLGGEAQPGILYAEIAGKHAIDRSLVTRILSKKEDLIWLKPNKNLWKIPTKSEYDL